MLRCESLSKSFGGVDALVDFSLELPDSGIVALVGPNGAGKTTLLNILTGFLQPDKGRCFLGTAEITRRRPHSIAAMGLARTFQEIRLVFQISSIENVLLPMRHQRGETLLTALARLRANDQEQHRRAAISILEDVGLQEVANELAAELSYGQQKLLSLATCLAMDGRVLLLDEPVAGVHPGIASQILQVLEGLKHKQKLVVFIEHDIDAVRRISDSVVVMDQGVIIAFGAPSEVFACPAVREAYLA